MEVNIDLETSPMETAEKIKGYVWHNYKMKYAKDKKGFWLIVNYRKKKYFGWIEETILGQAIKDNKTADCILSVVDNITNKITNGK